MGVVWALRIELGSSCLCSKALIFSEPSCSPAEAYLAHDFVGSELKTCWPYW